MQLVRQWLNALGYQRIQRRRQQAADPIPDDVADADRQIINQVRPYTMTSVARLLAAIDAARYVARNRIAGAVAECGVWRGGSMMAITLALLSEGDDTRDLYLYDTFQGMSAPTAADTNAMGTPAATLLRDSPKDSGLWCFASLDDVSRNMASIGYPADRIHLVEGKVEETIPASLPPALAILRLDTDWYESTKHELVHLYPVLVRNGVLIIDDYGHWQGAKRATDEYFASRSRQPLLHRIDYTGRMLVKGDLN